MHRKHQYKMDLDLDAKEISKATTYMLNNEGLTEEEGQLCLEEEERKHEQVQASQRVRHMPQKKHLVLYKIQFQRKQK